MFLELNFQKAIAMYNISSLEFIKTQHYVEKNLKNPTKFRIKIPYLPTLKKYRKK